MKLFLITIICFSISNTFFSQLNIQSGYDIGYYDMVYNGEYLLSENEGMHHLQRINFKIEYRIKNNFLVGFRTGIDFHNYRHDILLVSEGNNYTEIREQSINKSQMRSNVVGLLFGYKHPINNKSSLFLTINYNQFFISRIKNKESLFVEEYYSTLENNDNYLAAKTVSYKSMIDLDKVGYQNKLKLDNRHVMFSFGYRYQINDILISTLFKFSPFNRSLVGTGFIIPDNQNLFLFGINIGYTFPQKDQNDEK